MLSPLESGRFISDNSQHVKIHPDRASSFAATIYEGLKKKTFGFDQWQEAPLHPKTADDAVLEWIFVVDTLNFSFWTFDGDPSYTVTFGGQPYTGYQALCAAINRALNEGIPITDASFYANLSQDRLNHIFRSDNSTAIPLIEQRLQVLREAGQVLIKTFAGKFGNVVRRCGRSSKTLMELVYDNFPSYRDVAMYKGQQVSISKRLQILVADIWLAFQGQGLGTFPDMDTITAFADYRVPQVLAYYRVLSYSDELMDLLNKDTLLQSGCQYEVEIRGCTIRAVELITKELQQLLTSGDDEVKATQCNMILVDNYIWSHRRECAVAMQSVPFHKVRCIYY